MGADQWLEDGNCNVCRRSKYCSKPCECCGHKECVDDTFDGDWYK